MHYNKCKQTNERTMMNPFFSVIIPAYNAGKTLSYTLDSLLSQSCQDFEVILINDCSDDKTPEIIEKYKNKFKNLTVINNTQNIGVATSRNKGAESSQGEYIAFLDSDDLWHPNKLKIQKQAIISTGCSICCCSYSFINELNQSIKTDYIVPEKITYKMLLKENYIGCSSVVIEKKLFLNNKMDSIYYHEDYSLWLSLTRNNTYITGIKDVLMVYRISSDSRSFNKFNAAVNRYKIYRRQEKMGIVKSSIYFLNYSINGIKKKLL